MTGAEAIIHRAILESGNAGVTVDCLVAALYRPGRQPRTAADTVRKIVDRVRRRVDNDSHAIVTVWRKGRPSVYRIEESRR